MHSRWVPALAVLAGVLSVSGRADAAPPGGAVPTLTSPACSTAVATAPALAATPSFTNVPGLPFDVETTPDGRFTFVSSQGVHQPDGQGGGGVLVYRGDGSSGRILHTVPLGSLSPAGMAFIDGGRELLVAADPRLVVLDVRAAERGAPGSVLSETSTPGVGAIEVAPTPDGHLAFVTMENSDQVDVFRLRGDQQPRFVGAVPTGRSPVGVAFSPDGATAYVTSEIARGTSTSLPGTLSLVRVAVAEHHPAAAIERIVTAGCQPVRVLVSASGRTVWVTARGSNAVLAFSTLALARGAPALIADVEVGAAPVGLAFFDGGRRILVADSNRFGMGVTASLAVLDVAGGANLVGFLPAGTFPRQMTLEPGGEEIDVTNYQSSQLETVPLAPLVAAGR